MKNYRTPITEKQKHSKEQRAGDTNTKRAMECIIERFP